jgi:hypothetical protein
LKRLLVRAGGQVARLQQRRAASQRTKEIDVSMMEQHEQATNGSGSDVYQRLSELEKAQAVQAATHAGAEATQAATLAGAQSTQAAAHAGTWATMAAGSVALVVGMFLGLTIGRALVMRPQEDATRTERPEADGPAQPEPPAQPGDADAAAPETATDVHGDPESPS